MSTSKTSMVSNPFNVHVDWKETPEAHIFKGDFPGMKLEVEVEVAAIDGMFLQIKGERFIEEEDDKVTDKWIMVERTRGKFARRFMLPEKNVNLKGLVAVMEEGVLTITVPKKLEVESFGLEDLS